MSKIGDLKELNDKEKVLNIIIAKGINSIVEATLYQESKDQLMIESFFSNSLDVLIKCWPYLNKNVKFRVFEIHSDKFFKYMSINNL